MSTTIISAIWPTKIAGHRYNFRSESLSRPTPREFRNDVISVTSFQLTLRLYISVCHFLPGTSKWNKIEQRLFSFISSIWRELRGLKWQDYDEKLGTIQVQRKVVGSITGAPKTEAREAALDVMPMLRKVLAAYKQEFPPVGAGWVFRGKKGGPLCLDNLSRRDIPVHINGAWFGWHAFRRGLGTRLNEAGVDDKTIQSVLRHADISTTMAYYVQPNREAAKRGLQKLTDVLKRKYRVKV
jgi:integrase